MSNFSKKVKVQHRLNKLKLKAGAGLEDKRKGFIDPQAIKKAQAAIDEGEDHYTGEVEDILMKLDSTWDDLKAENDNNQVKKRTTELYNYANNIKDMAETFDYKLMGSFGESLRDFCEKIDMENKAHRTIAQAHIDVMWIAFKNNIKDEGGAQAQELQTMLAQAIEKHS